MIIESEASNSAPILVASSVYLHFLQPICLSVDRFENSCQMKIVIILFRIWLFVMIIVS